jgi:hypothetical protein
VLGEHAVVAQAFDLDEAAVGRKPMAQLGEIAQASAEVVGVADGGLGAERNGSISWHGLDAGFGPA